MRGKTGKLPNRLANGAAMKSTGPSEEQIRTWYPRLFRTALRMTGDADSASDLTQEAFLKALRSWGEFDGGALATTWLHRILVNCVCDWGRRNAVRTDYRAREWTLLTAAREQEDPSAPAQRAERLSLVRRAVEELPEAMRAVFAAVVLDGHTYKGASELLSLPVSTITSRVHEARKRIRDSLRRKFPEA